MSVEQKKTLGREKSDSKIGVKEKELVEEKVVKRARRKKPKKPFSFRRWLDEWRLAFSGVLLAARKWKFWVAMIVTFVFFGTLMNLLTNGFSTFELLLKVSFSERIEIISRAFLALFGVNRTFLDWASVFFVALLQGILVGLVAFVWSRRRKEQKEENSANAQTAGIVAGLAVLSSGCPTCGTTLLAPLIGAIGSSGGMALAGALSSLLMVGAIIIALLSLKKIGVEAYVIIISEKYKKRRKDA